MLWINSCVELQEKVKGPRAKSRNVRSGKLRQHLLTRRHPGKPLVARTVMKSCQLPEISSIILSSRKTLNN